MSTRPRVNILSSIEYKLFNQNEWNNSQEIFEILENCCAIRLSIQSERRLITALSKKFAQIYMNCLFFLYSVVEKNLHLYSKRARKKCVNGLMSQSYKISKNWIHCSTHFQSTFNTFNKTTKVQTRAEHRCKSSLQKKFVCHFVAVSCKYLFFIIKSE